MTPATFYGGDMPELMRPDGALVSYEITGSGKPVALLASHTQTAKDHAGALERLSANHQVVRIQSRYAERGRAPFAPFSYEQALEDQLAVLDAEAVQSFGVVAFRDAAPQALRMAYEAPVRVNLVALIEPFARTKRDSMDTYFAPYNETIRITRADGVEAVIAAAKDNPVFAENPAAGPWGQRLHDENLFCNALRSLRRENYIALIVEFRDGMFPWDRMYFGTSDPAVERIDAPILVATDDADQRAAFESAARIDFAPTAQAIDAIATALR